MFRLRVDGQELVDHAVGRRPPMLHDRWASPRIRGPAAPGGCARPLRPSDPRRARTQVPSLLSATLGRAAADRARARSARPRPVRPPPRSMRSPSWVGQAAGWAGPATGDRTEVRAPGLRRRPPARALRGWDAHTAAVRGPHGGARPGTGRRAPRGGSGAPASGSRRLIPSILS